MTIEVIEKGIPPSERSYLTNCHNCKSILRFKRSDAKYTSDQRDGDYLSINCPVCSQYITVGTESYEGKK